MLLLRIILLTQQAECLLTVSLTSLHSETSRLNRKKFVNKLDFFESYAIVLLTSRGAPWLGVTDPRLVELPAPQELGKVLQSRE